MPAIEVDLYSDTITRPTPGMRKAMAEAEVGNEQAHEDPSVNALVETVAAMMGQWDPLESTCRHASLSIL